METLDSTVGNRHDGAGPYQQPCLLPNFPPAAIRQGFSGFEPPPRDMPKPGLRRVGSSHQQQTALGVEYQGTHTDQSQGLGIGVGLTPAVERAEAKSAVRQGGGGIPIQCPLQTCMVEIGNPDP